MLIAILALSPFYTLSLSAASAPDPRSKPEAFSSGNPAPSSNPTYHPYIGAFKLFLQSTKEGQMFIKEVLMDNINAMPINYPAFRTNNTVEKYKSWYDSKFGAPTQAAVAAATAAARAAVQVQIDEQRRLREQAELGRTIAEEAVVDTSKQLAVAKKETVALKSQVANVGAILAGGGSKFSDEQINDLVTQIGQATEIEVEATTFEDATATFGFQGSINGKPIHMQIPNMDQAEYNRLKIIIAMVQKMHSKAYNAASGAMGDLITDILSSAQPQDYHFKQIAHLAFTSSKLDEYLKYHGEQSKNLSDWQALPLKDFLRIRFLKSEAVEAVRAQVLQEFMTLRNTIPNAANGLPFGSQAVDTFLKKIHSSIMLPTETAFSQQEIEEIFRELGLLLELDQSSEIAIDSDYFSKLYEVSRSVKKLKSMAQKRLDNSFNDSEYKTLFEVKEREIADFSKIPTPLNFVKLAELEDQNTLIESRGAQKLFSELAALLPSLPNMPYQDAGSATVDIRAGGANLDPIRAIIFLIQKFASPEQLAAVVKRSIIGELDPAILAALSMYYGLRLNDIKQALLNQRGFVFSVENYKKLKGSENVAFIKKYLESAMDGIPISVDWTDLKSQVLGIQATPAEKIKTALTIRTCELMNNSAIPPEVPKIEQKLSIVSVTGIAAQAAYFDNPAVSEAVLMYEVQDNTLKTEADKKRFLDSYLRMRGAGYDEKVGKLRDFFSASLAANAKETDLVKLVLTLPGIKQNYVQAFHNFGEAAHEFDVPVAEASASARHKTRIDKLREILKPKISTCSADERLILERALEKLTKLQNISREFLTTDDSTGALVAASNAQSGGPSFKVTAGLSQLDFDCVFNHNKYYDAFYNAVKILHFIELNMLSDDDFDMLKAIILSKISEEPSLESFLDGIFGAAKQLRSQSSAFYLQITKLLTFIDDFNEQKTLYDEPTGIEALDFYTNIDSLAVVANIGAPRVPFPAAANGAAPNAPLLPPAFGAGMPRLPAPPVILPALVPHIAAPAPANAVNMPRKRPPFNAAAFLVAPGALLRPQPIPGHLVLGQQPIPHAPILGNAPIPPGPLAPPPPPPPPLFANAAAVNAAPTGFSENAGMYSADASILQDPVFKKSDTALHKELFGGRPFAVGSATPTEKMGILVGKIDRFYKQILAAQLNYFSTINFTKVSEADVLPLVRQLMTCIDLYLRMHVYDTAKISTLKAGDKDSDQAKFKAYYLDVFTEYTLSKIYNTYNRAKNLSDQETGSVTKMLRNVNPELKKVIGNAILEVFSTVDLTAASSDIITPVIAKINAYLQAHPSLPEIVSIKSLPKKE